MNKLEPIVNGIVVAAIMYGIYGVMKLLIVAYKFF